MSVRQYEQWSPEAKTLALARDCVAIARRYQEQGYDLSVRQLYYQLVAADRVPNTMQSYQRVVNVVDRARMAGMMNWYMIVDRTRHLKGNAHWDSPDQIVNAAARGYAVDKWQDQPRRVEVWVEKEALSGVIGRVANDEDVSWFACRGYSSSSAMWRAAQRFLTYWESGQAVTILHLGDHDPSGIDMTRDIEDRLKLFLSVDWVRDHQHRFATEALYTQYKEVVEDLYGRVEQPPLEVRRIALNMDQVEQYQPPPNFAKVTDSRYATYREEHGESSWELDALEPSVLADLIRDHVDELRDDRLYNARKAEEAREQALLSRLTGRWSEVSAFLDELED
jgi:hypothetical protein